jgi:glycine/D-amino acid oxidase-like deaminating enzyme
MPALGGWEIVEHWAGLRPGSPDDLPILGPTEIANLFVASGQYRNGILFTPALAEAACNMILQRNAEPALAAFDPRRFARAAATG